MSLIGLYIFGHWYTGIPISFPQAEMIRVDKILDLLFYGSGVYRDVIFGEELFLSVVVEFIVLDWANFGLFVFLDV